MRYNINMFNEFIYLMILSSRKDKHMPIYNFVSSIDGPTWNEYFHVLFETNKKYPLHKAIYFPFLVCFQYKIPYIICICLGHLLPALLVDAANICLNRKPRYHVNVIFII